MTLAPLLDREPPPPPERGSSSGSLRIPAVETIAVASGRVCLGAAEPPRGPTPRTMHHRLTDLQRASTRCRRATSRSSQVSMSSGRQR